MENPFFRERVEETQENRTSMQPDGSAYVWDALRAVNLVNQFTADKSFDDYLEDSMLRSAVERQLEIIGEALNQFSRADPDAASGIPDLRRIVAFRNILAHGYASVDDAIVRAVVADRLAALKQSLREVAG